MLVSPGGGDELQGIKRGIMELADLLIITKADGNLLESAISTQADYAGALRLIAHRSDSWKPSAVLHSAHDLEQTAHVWQLMLKFHAQRQSKIADVRAEQNLLWMWRIVEDVLVKVVLLFNTCFRVLTLH